jgi:hypothetical protein
MRAPAQFAVIALACATAWRAPRAASSVPAIFSADTPIALRIDAPLEELFANARSDLSYAVEGTIAEAAARGSALRVKISLRGHTSRRESECTFPKLKLTFADPPPDGSPFAGLKRMKIGTHCGESNGTAVTERFGRLPNERSPYRETLAYRLLNALDVPTLKARAARITYAYADSSETLTRNAMLLEDDGDAIRRLGGKRSIAPDAFTNARDTFSTADAVALAFGEALIGNFDWCVKFTADDTYRCDARLKLWNVMAAAGGQEGARPLMYDFDVSGIVAGSHRWFSGVFNEAFLASRSHPDVEVIAQLQRTRTLFARADLDAGRTRFVSRRSQAYRVLDGAALDDEGRRVARQYLDAFFREIGSDETFYRPVVAAPHTLPRGAPDPGAEPVCGSRGEIPRGTPVSAPIRRSGDMIEVVVLDALWHWAPPVTCVPVQSGTVWIPAGSVTRDYP